MEERHFWGCLSTCWEPTVVWPSSICNKLNLDRKTKLHSIGQSILPGSPPWCQEAARTSLCSRGSQLSCLHHFSEARAMPSVRLVIITLGLSNLCIPPAHIQSVLGSSLSPSSVALRCSASAGGSAFILIVFSTGGSLPFPCVR